MAKLDSILSRNRISVDNQRNYLSQQARQSFIITAAAAAAASMLHARRISPFCTRRESSPGIGSSAKIDSILTHIEM